tara:strand:- start:312 stop:596 length:285 start_codon:yes stop_codon:yes gene_type:complete
MTDTNARCTFIFFSYLLISVSLAQSSLASDISKRNNGASARALEMQVQQMKARENVKHKMLQDQIASMDNRLKILEEKAKENEKEIKFLKRLSR